MKHNPHSFTSWATVTALAISAVCLTFLPKSPVLAFAARADEQAAATDTPAADAAAEPAAAKLTPSALTADQVFQKITDTLDGVETLSCDLTQTVVLSGQKFQAAGRYVQASGNRMRLEYRIFPIGGLNADDARLFALDSETPDDSKRKVTGSLEQVSDGSVLWSRWVNGPQKQLTRRNIREIVDAVNDVPNYSATQSLQDLGVGGLQTLMSQLQVGMEFSTVQEQQVGDVTLLVLAGRWNQKTRKEVFGLEDPEAPLPGYIPDFVRLYVDAKASLPRRIQYLKKHPSPEVKKVRPVVTLDLKNIRLNEGVSDEMFTFDRGEEDNIKEVDLTAQVIDAIKQIAAPAATGDSAATPEPAQNSQ